MDITKITGHLNSKLGYDISVGYHENIKTWLDWYKGYHEPFHHYTDYNGKETIELDRYTLKMAKKIAEDWASLLLNEKTYITIDHTPSDAFIQGENMTGGVFGANNFWSNANALVEKTFALGTGAFALRLDGEKIKIDFITADCIIPISYENGIITEVAFASDLYHKGRKYTYLETHYKGVNGKYLIRNEYFDSGFKPVTLFEDVMPEYDTKDTVPWFVIIKPNVTNNIDLNSPLGLSVYANAVDNLKGVDLAYDNLCTDFFLGGKMVMMNETLIGADKDGNRRAPQFSKKRLFMTMGDSVIDGKMYEEYNPELRVEDNTKGIQAQLNYLSAKCGFGERFYNFENGSVATATQIISENSSLFRNIKKHEIIIESALTQLVRSILTVAKNQLGASVDPDAEINVTFDDSIIEDKLSERTQDRADVTLGVMAKWEYRVKYYGEDEETAKAMIAQNQPKDMFGGDE